MRPRRDGFLVDWVRDLRASVPCDVILIHLYWPIAEYTRFGQTGPRALFEAEAASLGITTDVTIVDGGAPAEVICQTAERLGADAISLGSHGRGGLGRAVMGSVAARVLHQANAPVFVVRQPRDS